MNLQSYQENKRQLDSLTPRTRIICSDCWQPTFNCFCHQIKKIDPHIEFVILIHPIEARKRIATGRMSYLSLKNAHISRGCEFSHCPIVSRLISDTSYNNVVLSPGPQAVNLTNMSDSERIQYFSNGKKLRVFVIDGTWSNAGKMLRRTPELERLPRFYFIPDRPSNIRVRKQPNSKCYCTLEAIHHTIELLGPSQGFNVSSREHDRLLQPFHWLVNQQIDRIKTNKNWRVPPR